MKTTEKEVSYTINNTYSTLNELSNETKKVWIVFHGLGFLSRYFIKYFKVLNPEENFIIAPQAQAKHYLNGKYVHTGACWLTKENTAFEVENVMNYIDSVFANENIPEDVELNILGFSQGVSIATRWIASRKIPCQNLFLYAGKIPREFTATHFNQINSIKLIVGDQDEYITPELLENEKAYADELFGKKVEHILFDGKHVMNNDVIASLS